MRDDNEHRFSEFVEATEPKLHRALVAKLGWEHGREATAEALAYAWEHWDAVLGMDNPAGYLYRVGTSRVRPRRVRRLFIRPEDNELWVEPMLGRALSSLPERQRLAVVLIHGYGWTSREVATVTGLKPSTVQSHLERGLASLRSQLKIERRDGTQPIRRSGHA